MVEIFEKLTDYTLALREGLESTNEASERPLITGRLAAAAEMYALLHQSGDVTSIHDLVRSEVRAHGWSFVSGQAGKVVATKWVVFTSAVGIEQ
jgi:uroporphyrinogen-III synthase